MLHALFRKEREKIDTRQTKKRQDDLHVCWFAKNVAETNGLKEPRVSPI